MAIDYVHSQNMHSLEGAAVAFPHILRNVGASVSSLIDVGCGTGPWLRAAMDHGISDVHGVDGVIASECELAVARDLISIRNLTQPLEINRRFSVALCLEVAEHLDERHAAVLIASLVGLADVIVFSAACPNQPGQHHVNCQWPEYWQNLFNKHHYVCNDKVRWDIWGLSAVEPWYRQNIFTAHRRPSEAGNEPRLPPVVHPEMSVHYMLGANRARQLREIESGSMPISWYLTAPLRAVSAKSRRLLQGRGKSGH